MPLLFCTCDLQGSGYVYKIYFIYWTAAIASNQICREDIAIDLPINLVICRVLKSRATLQVHREVTARLHTQSIEYHQAVATMLHSLCVESGDRTPSSFSRVWTCSSGH